MMVVLKGRDGSSGQNGTQVCYLLLISCHRKKQPIRIQKKRWIFDGIKSDLAIMRCAYVALIVLAPLYSMACNKIVIGKTLSGYFMV